MTEIVIGKEALLHLLNIEGVDCKLMEPPTGEAHGGIETALGFMTFGYPKKVE